MGATAQGRLGVYLGAAALVVAAAALAVALLRPPMATPSARSTDAALAERVAHLERRLQVVSETVHLIVDDAHD